MILEVLPGVDAVLEVSVVTEGTVTVVDGLENRKENGVNAASPESFKSNNQEWIKIISR